MFVDTYVLVAVGVAEATSGSVFDTYFSVVAGVVDVCIGPCCGRSRSGQPFFGRGSLRKKAAQARGKTTQATARCEHVLHFSAWLSCAVAREVI